MGRLLDAKLVSRLGDRKTGRFLNEICWTGIVRPKIVGQEDRKAGGWLDGNVGPEDRKMGRFLNGIC